MSGKDQAKRVDSERDAEQVRQNRFVADLLCRYARNAIMGAADWSYPAQTVFNTSATRPQDPALKRFEHAAYVYGRETAWPLVGQRTLAILRNGVSATHMGATAMSTASGA